MAKKKFIRAEAPKIVKVLKWWIVPLILLITQISCWVIVTLLDAWNEYGNGPEASIVYCFGIPVVLIILYFIKREMLLRFTKHPWLSYLLMMLIWIALCYVFGYLIFHQVNYNKWIVKQNVMGEFNYNGLEYLLFAIFETVIPVVATLAGEGVLWLWSKRKKKK